MRCGSAAVFDTQTFAALGLVHLRCAVCRAGIVSTMGGRRRVVCIGMRICLCAVGGRLVQRFGACLFACLFGGRRFAVIIGSERGSIFRLRVFSRCCRMVSSRCGCRWMIVMRISGEHSRTGQHQNRGDPVWLIEVHFLAFLPIARQALAHGLA